MTERNVPQLIPVIPQSYVQIGSKLVENTSKNKLAIRTNDNLMQMKNMCNKNCLTITCLKWHAVQIRSLYHNHHQKSNKTL